MKSAVCQVPPNLRNLLVTCESIAASHSIPGETVMVHMLTLASALGGNLISSKPADSASLPARFSAIFQSNDPVIPQWMNQELEATYKGQLSLAASVIPPHNQRSTTREMQQQLRAIEALGGKNSMEARFLSSLIDKEKRRKSLRPLLPARNYRSGLDLIEKLPGGALAFFVRDAKDLKSLARARDGHWSTMGDQAGKGASLLGWVNRGDLRGFIKLRGAAEMPKLGWIIDCPAASVPPDHNNSFGLAATELLRGLERIRFAKPLCSFKPPAVAADILNLQVDSVLVHLKLLPEYQRSLAVPDTCLCWHFAALLVALCGNDTNAPDPILEKLCAEVGVVLAEHVFHNHLHYFRRCFPADLASPMEGNDLRVFRLLLDQPCSLRDLQRRSRGLRKADCLASLNKFTELGLAVEFPTGKFGKAPPPPATMRMSDFLSVYGLKSQFDLNISGKSTDNTGFTSL